MTSTAAGPIQVPTNKADQADEQSLRTMPGRTDPQGPQEPVKEGQAPSGGSPVAEDCEPLEGC
ncbi:hypothetical protein [Kitasatospora acidiphila]|uniref:hypothetical protein n=1 Tax=Kitasatospora acidiphila TaxID=2567942 RepID=UPI0015F0184E|nr:hypothetical protein [Kitasatospora acidiphila]